MTAVLMTRLAVLGLVVSELLGCGADEGPTGETGGACRTVGDLRLVFTGAADEEGGDLFGLTRDGQLRRLTDDGGSYGPSFSPDGSRIVFSSVGDEGDVSDTIGATGLDLYVMAADGSGRRLLDGEEDMSPAWSPDGDRIAFVRGGGAYGTGRIFDVDPDGDGSARLLVERDGPGNDSDPAWSPDGKQLAFVRTQPGGLSHLMVADADGSDARSVLERPEVLGSPSWSPDGTTLVVTAEGTGGQSRPSIVLIDLQEGSVDTVVEPGWAPVWSASGRLYAYGRSPGVADFSGRWRVAEFAPDGAKRFGTGRAISSLEPIGSLYGDAGIDIPRCDGPDTPPLTSVADVPETLVITDPATGDDVTVVPREQALALLDAQISGMSSGTEPAAKLVHTDAPDAEPLGLPPGRFVWVVMHEVTPSGELGIVVFDATTGDFIFSRGLSAESWDRLVDLAS